MCVNRKMRFIETVLGTGGGGIKENNGGGKFSYDKLYEIL
jgi:hypothetical protein